MTLSPDSANQTLANQAFLTDCTTQLKKENRVRIIGAVLLCIGAAIAYREQGQPLDIKPSLLPLLFIVAGGAMLVGTALLGRKE